MITELNYQILGHPPKDNKWNRIIGGNNVDHLRYDEKTTKLLGLKSGLQFNLYNDYIVQFDLIKS